MAMTNWHIQLIDFVLNGTTQTTALHIFTLCKTTQIHDAQRKSEGLRAFAQSLSTAGLDRI
jgi:hypothetical protein